MSRRRLHIESLEARLVLSLSLALGPDIDAGPVEVANLEVVDHHRDGHGGGPGGPGGGGGKPSGPAIDLPTVAAHEFGHSLGLDHLASNSSACQDANDHALMCPFYTDVSFVLHGEDIAALKDLYPASGPNPWGADDTTITYSFMPDGVRMEQGGRNVLTKTMDKAFGTDGAWQDIFADALELWAEASIADNEIANLDFDGPVDDDGAMPGASGVQGDIRIGSHNFDGSSGTLAHAWLPTTSSTIGGDAHFDKSENWQDLRGSEVITASFTIGGGGSVGAGDMTLLVADNSVAAEMTVTGFWTSSSADQPAADIIESVFADLDTDESVDLVAPQSQEIYLERALSAIGRRMSARATDDAFDRMSRGEADHVLEELSEDLIVPLSL